MAKFEANKNYCITSIRHSEEVKTFKTLKDFVLINVDTPQNVRFARMQLRKRPGDPTTLEKFIELEKKESQSSGSGQQVALCCQMADMVFINNEPNLQELYKKIDILLKDLNSQYNN